MADRGVVSRSPTLSLTTRKFARQSHAGFSESRKAIFYRLRRAARLGSIPIARSTFRCLACPCVVLGRGSRYRPVPTVSMWLLSVIGPIADSHERPLSSPQILGEAQQALSVFDKKDSIGAKALSHVVCHFIHTKLAIPLAWCLALMVANCRIGTVFQQ